MPRERRFGGPGRGPRLRRADYERAVVEEAARRSDERVAHHEVAVHVQ
jgi:hypothetical protein